ncbi:MAG: DtxR family transcriptional regulator [Roseiflexaceae bacterium]|jgi:DtxR family Mn-dependent transcriptional regulator|nr:metal-dependent transcriptional regulator [Chloroflexaceae bacterium]
MSAPDPRTARVTHAMEDYLKGIYEISLDNAQVTTSLIAQRMAVKPASVSGMLRTLADMHLVTHTPYYGVALTPAGQQIALEVLRHHRLIELYLVEALGFKWDEVHDEADRLEHVISEKFEARIADLLGHPTMDPHGDPIPAHDGTMPPHTRTSLADMAAGTCRRIVRVRGDHHSSRLQYLASLGLIPGNVVTVCEVSPFDGPLMIFVDQKTHALDRRLAQLIYVAEHLDDTNATT